MARYNSYSIAAGGKAELISPPLYLPSDDFRVVFFMYRDTDYSSRTDAVNVYINTTNSSVGGNLLGTVHRSTILSPAVPSTGWYEYSFNLPGGSAGSVRFIIFESVSDFGHNMYIDDVMVQQIPLAPVLMANPETLDFGPVAINTSLSKVISLSNIGPGVLHITDIQLAANPDNDFSILSSFVPVQLSYGQSISLTLQYAPTAYLSGSGSSTHIASLDVFVDFAINMSVSLSGSCYDPLITEFPWLETFEDDSVRRNDWTQIQEAGSALWSFQMGSGGASVTQAYAGIKNARFVSLSGQNNHITKLVTPVLDLSGIDEPQLQFYYAQPKWSSDQNTTKVYYRTGSMASWNLLAHYTGNVTSWTEVTLALPDPSSTYQIAFEGINNWGYANVLDNVCVRSSPELPPPPPPPPPALNFAMNIGGGRFAHAPYVSAFNTEAMTIEMWFKTNIGGHAVEFLSGRNYEQMEIHLGGGNPNSIRFIPTTRVYVDTQPNVIT
ncbi:MAG: choice-of-anchor J domain-containing protein, partial [Candidatus Cloacimonadaceae bacterium]|nr:choice-of-anchor J domain-containing protein [Candidatus Cloacimonadaceae bacterium]